MIQTVFENESFHILCNQWTFCLQLFSFTKNMHKKNYDYQTSVLAEYAWFLNISGLMYKSVPTAVVIKFRLSFATPKSPILIESLFFIVFRNKKMLLWKKCYSKYEYIFDVFTIDRYSILPYMICNFRLLAFFNTFIRK